MNEDSTYIEQLRSFQNEEREKNEKQKDNVHAFITGAISEFERRGDTYISSHIDTIKSLRSLQHYLDMVESTREEYQKQIDSLEPLKVKVDNVKEEVSEVHQNEKGIFGKSVGDKKSAAVGKPYSKESEDYLESSKQKYEQAVENLEKFLVSKDNHGIKKDKNGNYSLDISIPGIVYDVNPYAMEGDSFDSGARRATMEIEKYINNVTSSVRVTGQEHHIQEEMEKANEVETQETDKIRDTIEFYESDKFHGVRVIVHGKHLLEKMTEREKLISSIDRALDELGDLKGFDETKKALEELKRQEELNFEKERTHFEKETGYQGIVQAIEKDKAIEQYADKIREKNVAGSEREAYLIEQELEKLQETLGLTSSEVSEATRRVDREEEAKRADEQIEKSEQMAKERVKNERIDREIAADKKGHEAVDEALRRGQFKGPDFNDTGYNEQQISEETERAKEEFARGVYDEVYHQAVKPGLTEKEETLTDSEAYKELEQVNDELRIAVTEYLTDTQNGKIYGVQPYDVEVMMERLKEEKNMSPEERAIAALKRENTRGFDENTTVDNLNQVQRTQVEAQVRVEQNKGITSALDKLKAIEKARVESDARGYDPTSTGIEEREYEPFDVVKKDYETSVAKRNQEKVEKRQEAINASKQTVVDELEQVTEDYQVDSEETKRGAHK